MLWCAPHEDDGRLPDQQYDTAVAALETYYHTVQLALVACLGQDETAPASAALVNQAPAPIEAIVFGSDQGMVGQFNDTILAFASDALAVLPGKKTVWAVGRRIAAQLAMGQWSPGPGFDLPGFDGHSRGAGRRIAARARSAAHAGSAGPCLPLPSSARPGTHAPLCQRLLPLDQAWRREIDALRWPTRTRPEVLGARRDALSACVSEYLFVALLRACAESQASENASRLAAMQRAEKNIDELLDQLNLSFHSLRQNAIDEELFDLVAGFEALPRG